MTLTERESTAGLAKDGTYAVGVRRTFASTPQHAWDVLTSPEGLAIWLGADLEMAKGAAYQIPGAAGVVRVVSPGSHVRLTWHPDGWAAASTIQVRVLPAAGGTTVSFHQENLPGAAERAAMQQRWSDALDRLAGLLVGEEG
ncbi:MAG TPA: SRPBCC domain-containing protein [Herpetosiphonaceae bacterium]|nr:SRPBCC domain-containing protein [Herpetosiphonaceae bacterium]